MLYETLSNQSVYMQNDGQKSYSYHTMPWFVCNIHCICWHLHIQICLFTCGWAVVIITRDPFHFHTFALVFRQYQVLGCIRDIWKPSQKNGFGKYDTSISAKKVKGPKCSNKSSRVPEDVECEELLHKAATISFSLKMLEISQMCNCQTQHYNNEDNSACPCSALVSWHTDPFKDVSYIIAAAGFSDPLTRSRNMAHRFTHLTPRAALRPCLCPLEFLPDMCTHPGLRGLHW